jgi:hypothetical protein
VGLKKVFSGDFNTQKLQDNLADSIRRIENITLLGGNIVKNISFLGTGTDVQVNHGLGREPIGWILIESTADLRIYKSSTVNNLKDKLILFRSNAAYTGSIYIF